MRFRPPGVPLPKYALPGSDWSRPARKPKPKPRPRPTAPAAASASPPGDPVAMTMDTAPTSIPITVSSRRKPYQGRPCPQLDEEVTMRLEAISATEDTADLSDEEKLQTVLEDITLLSADDHVGIASDADRRAWRRIQREARKRLDAIAADSE